ncbi:hypothetical protein V8E51_003201 [Hyaloscypha variabilis]
MDVFYAYTYGTAGWLALQSLPLIVSPTIILALLNVEVREPSDLEEYFSRSLGITMLAVGALVILLSGSVPLTSSLNVTTDEENPKAPYATPTLTISFIYHAAMGFYCYGNYSTTGQSAFALGALGSGLLAAIGLWVLLFASSQGHISRKTGADKRTSGFPFNNQESASAKKKQLRKGI